MSKKSFSVQMADILKEIGANVDESIDEALNKVPKKAAAKLRNVSPKDDGRYAKGWRSKRIDDKTVVVYNASLPGFTHLLENGHVIKNAKGEYGRTNGQKHIAPVEEEYVKEFIMELMQAKL